jgi:hypothetical protein
MMAQIILKLQMIEKKLLLNGQLLCDDSFRAALNAASTE